MRGCIGKLKPKAETHFYKGLDSIGRFDKFKNISKSDFIDIKSSIELVWTQGISFNNVPYWSYNEPQNYPIKLSTDVPNKLKSDSTFRKDIEMRANGDMNDSRAEK